jgi:hypothetical protein
MDRSRRSFNRALLLTLASFPAGAASAPSNSRERATAFRPSLHGWPFQTLDAALTFGPLTTNFGTCGGMCWTALDRFYRNEHIDRNLETPSPDNALYEEIRSRQFSTLTIDLIGTLNTWITRPDLGSIWEIHSIGHLTRKQEWPVVRKEIDAGRPVTICLVRTKKQKEISKNHQVLAYEYSFDRDVAYLGVYDPGHPNRDDVTLSFYLRTKKSQLNIWQSTGPDLRGFFVVPYEPPDELLLR